MYMYMYPLHSMFIMYMYMYMYMYLHHFHSLIMWSDTATKIINASQCPLFVTVPSQSTINRSSSCHINSVYIYRTLFITLAIHIYMQRALKKTELFWVKDDIYWQSFTGFKDSFRQIDLVMSRKTYLEISVQCVWPVGQFEFLLLY